MNAQRTGFLILMILFGFLTQGALFAQDASPKSNEEILAEIERIVGQTNWTLSGKGQIQLIPSVEGETSTLEFEFSFSR